jgi:hypothetical protein
MSNLTAEGKEYLEESNNDVVEDISASTDLSLSHLAKGRYVSKAERDKAHEEQKQLKVAMKEQQKVARQREIEDRRRLREEERMVKAVAKKAPKVATVSSGGGGDDDSIFDGTGSEILGKGKRVLLTKVRQMKNLFPEELKGFKVKRNPTEDELQAYLDEMQVIIDTGTVDGFLVDGVLQALRVVEGASSFLPKYNVTGMVDILKSNKQFHSLAKQLFIKYGMYSNVPPEYQMVLLVATTAYVCRCKNLKKAEMEMYLNEPIANTISQPSS